MRRIFIGDRAFTENAVMLVTPSGQGAAVGESLLTGNPAKQGDHRQETSDKEQADLDKTPEIPYFTTNSALLHTPSKR
jgi:hypothetical protein